MSPSAVYSHWDSGEIIEPSSPTSMETDSLLSELDDRHNDALDLLQLGQVERFVVGICVACESQSQQMHETSALFFSSVLPIRVCIAGILVLNLVLISHRSSRHPLL